MRVLEVMTPEPVTVTPWTSLMEARRLLGRMGGRHLPVIDGDAVVGMVSDRDLLLRDRELAEALAHLHSELVDGRYRQVADVMSSPVVTVEVDASAAAAARLLGEHHISALPVLKHGRLVGIVTTSDLLAAIPDDDAQPPVRPGVTPAHSS